MLWVEIIPMFCTLIPIIGYIPCNTTFNLNRAVNPGYKYFHSLSASVEVNPIKKPMADITTSMGKNIPKPLLACPKMF